MSKKNIIFIPCLDKGNGSKRHSAYHFSINSWKQWSARFPDIDVFVLDEPLYPWETMTFPWQRYYLFDILEANGIDYDQILMVDADTIVHPQTPNFFNITERKYCAVLDLGCWEWTARSIRLYQKFFPNFKLDRGLYFNGGFQIVNEQHKPFFRNVISFYETHNIELRELQKQGLGTDQTPVNYLVQTSGIDLKILPPTYNLHSLSSKNLLPLGSEWWGDSLQNMYEQGWVYHFNALGHGAYNRTTAYFLERAYKELYE